ncbi:MAG: polysaccharide deacetylase family protein [Planctomycetes bacterium]|nr:polysaccharide deacetylase family protein [Planctomycetota bacterium]
MRIVWIGFAALAAGVTCAVLVPRPAATWIASALLVAFVAAVVRGVASMRSSLIERTAWRSGDLDDRRIALTFDDGPHPVWTPRVLDALRARGVRATFFVVGANARRHPELVRRMVEEGHDVGCHGDSHSPWTAFFPRGRMEREVVACLDAVRAAAGVTPRLHRPPYGLRSPAHAGLAARQDLVVVGMARRGHDKDAGATADAVSAAVTAAARPGEILALHDGDEHGREDVACAAAGALPSVLDALVARGLRPVAVSDLLGERPYRESARRGWTGRTHGGRAGNGFFVFVVRTFGTGAAVVPLALVAAWFTAFKGEARRASIAFRRRIHGRAAWPVELVWTWRHFFTYGRTLLWRVAALHGARAPRVEHVGYDAVRACIDAPGPILLVSGHLGDWSGACRRLVSETSARPLAVVALRGTGLGPHQVQEQSGDAKYRLIDVEGGSTRIGIEIASALAAGGAVAIHADRTMDDDRGVRVPFLGGEALFPSGVWKVAMVTGAPAVVYFAIPLAADRVRIHSYGPVRVPKPERGGRDEAVRRAAAEFARHLETCVRLHPLHWGNFHDVWGGA